MIVSAKHSINFKLARLVILAVSAAMIIVAGFSAWREAWRYLDAKRDSLITGATAFAAASADAVSAHDERLAYQAIRGIASLPTIEFVSLQDDRQRALASLGSGVRLTRDLDLTDHSQVSPFELLSTNTVSVTLPVKQSGNVVGSIRLVAQVADLWMRLLEDLTLSFTAAICAIGLGLVISIRLQRSITNPLVALAKVMARIEHDHDYNTHVPIESDDEIGVLATSFNSMILEVRGRDEQLMAHRDRLEQDVFERTQDLEEAKQDAETANAAKSTFLATMSHEIRTPLSGLMVMAELLASSDLPSRSKRYADIICKSGTALLAIINDILDFSKIEAGKLETEYVRVDIRDLVGTVISLFYSRATEKGLDLAARFSSSVPIAIEGDPVRLQQIIGNLVNNALKFTKAGHVLVDVNFVDGVLSCAVIDTGIGIETEKLQKIFQAFSQADQSTTREFGGTGLGLSISKRLCEAMCGQIHVQSALEKGTTFTLQLPAPILEATPSTRRSTQDGSNRVVLSITGTATLQAITETLERAGYEILSATNPDDQVDIVIVDDDAPSLGNVRAVHTIQLSKQEVAIPTADDKFRYKLPFLETEFLQFLETIQSGQSEGGRQTARPRGLLFPTAKILVADDTAVNREIMIEALKQFAIEPDLAENGLDALKAALIKPYDLILMDGSMPVMDGFEACRQLREKEIGPRQTPVVALTAHVVGAAAEAWRTAGMNGILHKPFKMADLSKVLTTFLAASVETPDFYSSISVCTEPNEIPMAAEPLFDDGVISEIMSMTRAGNKDFAQRVFRLFLDHAPASWQAIKEALASSDCEGLAAAAHALKSMSLNIGAKRTALCAASLERSSRDGFSEQGKVDALGLALEETRKALEQRLSGHMEAMPLTA